MILNFPHQRWFRQVHDFQLPNKAFRLMALSAAWSSSERDTHFQIVSHSRPACRPGTRLKEIASSLAEVVNFERIASSTVIQQLHAD
jgi:hypothetical protein